MIVNPVSINKIPSDKLMLQVLKFDASNMLIIDATTKPKIAKYVLTSYLSIKT